jgi:uncharacterized protein (DUF433 family)
MNYADRIAIDPEVRGGKPCIKGTRITVYDILEYLAGGMTEVEILADFPSLQKEDIRATLSFAAAREGDLEACGDLAERIRGRGKGEPPAPGIESPLGLVSLESARGVIERGWRREDLYTRGSAR